MKTHLTLFFTAIFALTSCDRGPAPTTNDAPQLKENWQADQPKKDGAAPADGPKLKADWDTDSKSKEPQGSKPTLKADWDKKPAPSAGTGKPKAKTTNTPTGKIEKVNGFDKLIGCQLVDHRNNDGDSFHIRHNGKTHELRLYYVDTAEKYYSDRYENQRARVREQGKDFGGLSVEQVIEVGEEGKKFTLELLEGKNFNVFTKWEEVYDSGRYYAFVEVPGGKGRYLSEYLVASGLVRLKTKGVETPDGRDYRTFRDYLNQTERRAKSAGMGAWGK